ncbi:hypothetical protein MK489_22600 [Myxococcota bacterium]|nr:hypothetical protein [Myxococcota bacterium]
MMPTWRITPSRMGVPTRFAAILAVAILGLVLVPAMVVPAGTIAVGAHHTADKGLGLAYPMGGDLVGTEGTCSGTLIEAQWMLAAEHGGTKNSSDFAFFNGTQHPVAKSHVYPDVVADENQSLHDGFDIALLKLDQTPVGIPLADLYDGSTELRRARHTRDWFLWGWR